MTEIWVESPGGSDAGNGTQLDPFLTIGRALKQVSGQKDCIHLSGTFTDGIKLSKMKFSEHLLIDGGGLTLLYGFEGPKEQFDPLSMPPRTWGTISVMDCHNVCIMDLTVWGGIMQTVHLSDSYPEIGLKSICLGNIEVRYGAKRGIFMGGHNIENIKIEDCLIHETVYGDTTHGIYLSGGHWRPEYPPIRNVKILNTKVHHSGGRHGIQLNGRFSGVEIDKCRTFFNEFAGVSLIGVQDCTVSNSLIWGNNRQGVIIYDYFDHKYWDITDDADVAKWKGCHHPNQNITLLNNTILVGPKQWKRDEWHNNTPANKAAILVNCNNGKDFPEFKPSNLHIRDNILWSKTDKMVAYGHNFDAKATIMEGNMCWVCDNMGFRIPKAYAPAGAWGIEYLNVHASTHFKQNMVMDPEFSQIPEYDFIDLTKAPFDFSMHSWKVGLDSGPAREYKKGAKLRGKRPTVLGEKESAAQPAKSGESHPWKSVR